MYVKILCIACFCSALVFFAGFSSGAAFAATSAGSEGERLALPAPDKSGGKPLMQALSLRASKRAISPQPIAEQDLSNLLWATWGVNRADGRRTVPTAKNSQEVELYVSMASGVWRYEGEKHELVKVLGEDVRGKFGGAPVTLVFAAEKGEYAGMHVGSMYQNAGLYCASAGLANVVKATGVSVLQGRLPLRPNYAIFIIQSVGLPK